MANGASRIFKIMQNAGTDTLSYMLSLTVKSISPMTLTDGDKLLIPGELCVFNQSIDISKLRVGDKFTASTFNDGQTYYINQKISTSQEADKYNLKINGVKTSLEAQIAALQGEISSLKSRVTALEERI